MGRTRTKTRKTKPPVVEVQEKATSTSQSQPSVSSLIEKAQELIVQCDYELAGRFVQRVLERSPDHAEALEMMGVVQLETGELDAAKETFLSLISPQSPQPPPPAAYLYLAQLSVEDPQEALQYYRAAVDILSIQLQGKERAVDSAAKNEDEQETRRTIVRALIGQVEIWMDPEYELCFDPAAEKTCEDLLELALQTDPDNVEALQSLASVRMSQQRPDDAKSLLEKSWNSWKNLENDDPRLPPIPSRLALTKLFLELELFTPALLVLTGIMAADDEEVEAWYLEGWCFFMMAEMAHEQGGTMDELSWETLAQDSRDCLETCKTLHMNQEHPDLPLLEHVSELIEKLEELGVKASPEEEGQEEGGDWEDMEDSDDDEDIEMS
ncbi:TPR-like protein [Stereum hirsutum FP-91666 SS1]|uniref:TPR-like protein n=1 Tax=Stereum hirsutum (strain FP-91666) TaxID=721885 RepID=UPI000440FE52|nr:TPR-like protein [Stereum hirsutum FP-91666 SS1]EIM90916.1 TPR-like protein [Stereum hirsutum FP-91666 SS1]